MRTKSNTPKPPCTVCSQRPQFAKERCNPCYQGLRRIENPERIKAHEHKNHARHRERYREASQQWREQNRERQLENLRRWNKANRTEAQAYQNAWRKIHPDAPREYKNRRRARLAGVSRERISWDAVYARDGGRCHLCGESVERGKMSLDHVVPLAAGGEHTFANVRLAHRRCNSRRRHIGPAQPFLL